MNILAAGLAPFFVDGPHQKRVSSATFFLGRSASTCGIATAVVKTTYTACRCSAATVGRQSAPSRNRVQRARCLNLGRLCNASSGAAYGLFCAPPMTFLRRLGEIYMFLLVVGFGVATLFATGLLLVMQILEDCR